MLGIGTLLTLISYAASQKDKRIQSPLGVRPPSKPPQAVSVQEELREERAEAISPYVSNALQPTAPPETRTAAVATPLKRLPPKPERRPLELRHIAGIVLALLLVCGALTTYSRQSQVSPFVGEWRTDDQPTESPYLILDKHMHAVLGAAGPNGTVATLEGNYLEKPERSIWMQFSATNPESGQLTTFQLEGYLVGDGDRGLLLGPPGKDRPQNVRFWRKK